MWERNAVRVLPLAHALKHIVVKTLHPIISKYSSGHDGISTKLLKCISPLLISPLRVVINHSLITGIYPDKLKIAKVIPLFKKDDKA